MQYTKAQLVDKLVASGIEFDRKANKATLIRLLEAEAVNAEAEAVNAEAEAVNAEAESMLVKSLSRKALQALTAAESKRHTLYIGSTANKSADTFATFRFLTDSDSFATLADDESLPGFTRIDSLDLATQRLLVSVTLESYVRVANPIRGNAETVVRASASAFLLPVSVAYNPTLDRLELTETPSLDLWRYTKTNGFNSIDDKDIGKRIPNMNRETLYNAIRRKLASYVKNNAGSVNDRMLERNGQLTLFGQYRQSKR